MSAEQELAIIKHKNERIEELIAVNEQLTNALESVYHVQDGYEEQVQMLKARVREVLGENARLTARVEQLRGLAQSAAGWLSEAGEGTHAARVLGLVGDMEPGATAQEELAEARRDAERLDWLEQTSAKKDLSLWAIVPNSDEPVWFVREEDRNIDLGDGFSIREAIDAAIAREGNNGRA